MRDYKKYDVWNLAHAITKDIYLVSQNFPREELFGLTSQIRRAAISIPSNIAEGCGRGSDKEFARFVEISIGSTNETEYQLFLAFDLNFIDLENYELLAERLNILRQKLIQLRKKLLE
ncbi:MAG: four helix bundle protein [Kaistella sp.]|nr:four helix bundle protein [Kaistella sp.]